MPRSVLAWIITGPLGHLAAGIADWVALVVGNRAALVDATPARGWRDRGTRRMQRPTGRDEH